MKAPGTRKPSKARVRDSAEKMLRVHHVTLRKLARPEESKLANLVDRIEPLARQLQALKTEAEALGVFVGDRELLECSNCGLAEDVLADGRLITFRGTTVMDTELRFTAVPASSTRDSRSSCSADLGASSARIARGSPSIRFERSPLPRRCWRPRRTRHAPPRTGPRNRTQRPVLCDVPDSSPGPESARTPRTNRRTSRAC